MLIECPSCASRYVIDAAKIGAEGRNVRCASCQKEWFVTQADGVEPEPEPGPAPAAGSPAAAGGTPQQTSGRTDDPQSAPGEREDAPSPGGAKPEEARTPPAAAMAPRKQNNIDSIFEDNSDAPDTSGHSWDKKQEEEPVAEEEEPKPAAPPRPRPPPAPPRKPSPAAVLRERAAAAARSPLAVGLVGAALVAGLLWQRERVVLAAPSSAGLYAALGMPVNLARLEFGEVRSSLIREGQARFLVVEAVVRNPLPAPRLVPRIETVVRDGQGRALYSWASDPPRATLRPGEALHFRTRLATPPEEGRDVAVRFVTGERPVEAKR